MRLDIEHTVPSESVYLVHSRVQEDGLRAVDLECEFDRAVSPV